MEKPEAKRRATIVTTEEFDELLRHVDDIPFRDLLIVSYDSGSRPQETKQLEARHIQADKQRAVIPGEEAKGGIPLRHLLSDGSLPGDHPAACP